MEVLQTASLSGRIDVAGSLSGQIDAVRSLVGTAAIAERIGGTPYEGAYTVRPKTSAQILATENRVLTRDITVQAIPFYEVSNVQDGVTIVIGGE